MLLPPSCKLAQGYCGLSLQQLADSLCAAICRLLVAGVGAYAALSTVFYIRTFRALSNRPYNEFRYDILCLYTWHIETIKLYVSKSGVSRHRGEGVHIDGCLHAFPAS